MRINQGDPQWANLPYRDLPYTVVEEGCGLCAVSMCADLTPLDTIDFMRKFATNGNGTTWEGIDKGLDKFVGNHKRNYVSESMAPLWDELAKGKRVGIILFGKNSIGPDGTEWTIGGHYVEFEDYKVEGGQHWFYTQDSSYRNHTGWYSYEQSMRGCIPSVVWTAKKMKNGWIKENGSWYFYDKGEMVKNEWRESEGKWYWLGSEGKMLKSRPIEWKGNIYYLKGDGSMASKEWIKFPKGWKYYAKDGKMAKGWLKYKNNMYYLKPDGYMATGKLKVMCVFDKDGKMVSK